MASTELGATVGGIDSMTVFMSPMLCIVGLGGLRLGLRMYIYDISNRSRIAYVPVVIICLGQSHCFNDSVGTWSGPNGCPDTMSRRDIRSIRSPDAYLSRWVC